MRIAMCVAFAAVFGCQAKDDSQSASQGQAQVVASKPTSAQPTGKATGDGYAGDIDRICNAEALSGAADMEEGARPMQVAQWLGSNIKTEEGRQFLASLARAKPADKAKLLRSESSKLGIASCALAKAWSGGGQSTL